MPSICARCVFLHGEAKRSFWKGWLCTKVKIEPVLNPVTGENTEPYQVCWKLNDGSCEMFEEGRNCLSKEEKNGPEQA